MASEQPDLDRTAPAKEWGRRHWELVRTNAASPAPPPAATAASRRLAYGLSQPFLGITILLRRRELWRHALIPVLAVAGLCTIVALATGETLLGRLTIWWTTFYGLAPLPAVVFAHQYARLASHSRNALGLGPSLPHLKSWSELGKEWLKQALILSLGLAPLTVLIKLLPGLGDAIATALVGGWTLHWMTIEGLDAARTDSPEALTEPRAHTSPAALSPAVDRAPQHALTATTRPWWFQRWLEPPLPAWLTWPLTPSRWMARGIARLARVWTPELDLVERSPWETFGFGLGTAIMLSIPGLNLLFRPAVVIGGMHLRYRIDRPGPAGPAGELQAARSPSSSDSTGAMTSAGSCDSSAD